MRWSQVLKMAAVLGLTVLLGGCVTHVLRTGLSEDDAQEIVVLLSENGIEASTAKGVSEKKGEEKWNVVIRGGDQNLARAWRVLEENGLPREKDKGLDGVFSNSGMIPTASEEKARLLVGISGEISRALKSVSGVVDAHVLVVLPDNTPLLDKSERVPPTASVLIKYRGPDLPLADDDVKKLVARAVEGLQPENVAVVYKKVQPRQAPNRNVIPLLGNQEFLLAALALLTITSLGCVGLVAKSRWQRSKIESLQQKLNSAPVQAPAQARLPETPAAQAAGRS